MNPLIRTTIALVAIIACFSAAWTSARIGLSRLLTRYATAAASLPVADQAVLVAPSDPEAHRGRGAVLRYLGQLPEAAKEYEAAVNLRPLDDLLWLELGTVRDELDDSEGAVNALNQSVRTAPYYSLPRWQRGNVLLRLGRYDEAFADLRQAADSNKELQPNLVDLAWGISRFDPQLTEQILQINSDQMRLRFARLLAVKGRGPEAAEQFRAAGTAPALVREDIVSLLIDKKAFKDAFQIWKGGTSSDRGEVGHPSIFDGGFEAPLILDERGFGWRMKQSDGLNLSVDAVEKQSGAKSLRIQYNGNSNPEFVPVAQFILVEPSKRYRLSFSARSQDVVSGGLPMVTVADAMSGQLLAKSTTLRQGTNDWLAQGVEFTTGQETNALSLGVRRENCASTPCPIFGIVWLDSFSLEQIK